MYNILIRVEIPKTIKILLKEYLYLPNEFTFYNEKFI